MADPIYFKVGSGNSAIDYSNRVLAGSYNVQTKPKYKTWEDANGLEHRTVIRSAVVSGSFDMWFKTITEYNNFVTQVTSSRLTDLTVPCTIRSNTTDTEVSSYFYIDFSPVRNRTGKWTDIMERFTVSVKEK